MSKPMERPTGAVEEEKREKVGDPSPLSPPRQPGRRAGRETSHTQTKPDRRYRVAAMIEEAVDAAVERRFQRAKDIRWAKLEKQYGSLNELAERAGAISEEEGTGASAEQAAEVKEQDLLAEPEGDAPEYLAQPLAERVQALAKMPGLKENEDARAMLLRHARPEGIEEYAALLEDLLLLGGERPAQVPGDREKSIPASAVIPGGGDAPADLRQAYERRKRALRPGDINALTALKREFRQRGLDVF